MPLASRLRPAKRTPGRHPLKSFRSSTKQSTPKHVDKRRKRAAVEGPRRGGFSRCRMRRWPHLLHHAGANAFRRFTPESLAEIERRMVEEKEEQEGEKHVEVAEEDLPKPKSDLEAGKSVPFIYGDPPRDVLNVPLEDLDPFYKAQKVGPVGHAQRATP
ncbi:hypothetical protein SKAU_G00296440 [Synaphobranchus kaupii]|uniref:Uncharacterized protein n=1 Tax=Synaphobranchus kaupii TaxID=118154 RepID=A0A9Q1EUV6_SYNKA|nr:hypothetical protein SKAU_G00296440 [Synaphobranchus kaupii]